jgi:threonine aldolase
MIDLRSDTVTKPTAAMRQAMARAEVGDDVYGEDPTVNRLQEKAAELVGKEAALFVPTGTMANQIAIRAQTSHGDQVLAGTGAHILRYESGAAAAISGVQIKTLGRDGTFTADEVDDAVPPRDHHNAPATLVAIENTHNAAGGTVWPIEQSEAVAAAARRRGLRVHLDGARLFNAVVASGVPAQRWAEACDTVCFCFSKGLGAPVGSIVCGDRATIDRGHRFRKMFGGGMRQAGIIAAAALHALEHHVDRLREDHDNAERLAAGLDAIGLRVDPKPETNIVLFHCDRDRALAGELARRGVLVNLLRPGTFRAVTHLDVDRAAIDEAVDRCRDALRSLASGS